MLHHRCLACVNLDMRKYEIDDRGHDFGGVIKSDIEYKCGRKCMSPVVARKEWCGRWKGAYGEWIG